ncbi:MAG: hypothetical protein RIM99_14930 [Cyclobacteriaceae bacterium]
MKNLSAFIILILILFSCKVNDLQSSDSSDQEQFYINTFMSKWGQSPMNYQFLLNEDGSMVLCARFSRDNIPVYDYSVYDIESKKEIYSSGFIGSEISWKSRNELEISGTSRMNAAETIIINVLTKESGVGNIKSIKN